MRIRINKLAKIGVISLLIAAMLLPTVACGKKDVAPEPQSISVVEKEPEIIVTPIEEVEIEEEPVEEVVEAPEFINPLTGEASEVDMSQTRPVAAMLNTTKVALPQSGNASADILIEMQEEGGVTRIMALYQDVSKVGTIGTIRSTREYFAFLAMGFDAVLLHCGGSSYGLKALKNNNYKSLNEMTYGNLYWRDKWRQKNVGQEHSLYTSGENISKYLNSVDEDTFRSEHYDGYTEHFQFAEDGDGTPINGESAANVKVIHSEYKSTGFAYDETTKTYKVSAFGSAYQDEDAGTQVEVTNIIIVQTNQRTKQDGTGEGRQEYDLDSGSGYYACGGMYVPITWKKGGTFDELAFYDKDGNPLKLGVGKTYINIVDYSRTLKFE